MKFTMFVSRKDGTLAIFMHYWMQSENIHALWVNLWAIFMYFCTSIHAFECNGVVLAKLW